MIRPLDDGEAANPGADIKRQDEVLELLFWFEGEGFDQNATLPGLARFLAYDEQDVEAILGRLIERGDVSQVEERFTLTALGRREAGRRFQENFGSMLAQGHGECSDPDCDCHDDPDGAAACRGHSQAAHDH